MRVPTVKIKNEKTGVVRIIDASVYARNMDKFITKGWAIVSTSRTVNQEQVREIQDSKPVHTVIETENDVPVNIAATESDLINAYQAEIDQEEIPDPLMFEFVADDEVESENKPKKRRGRPRKTDQEKGDDNNEFQSEGFS